ncbi:hypothetical protein BJV78DRAFT_1159358 [Lactifluus subvellereus]|nr:hypothetical protein BJV78DRAFT_1159358 [Lactifluus subvellereus]
MYCGVNAKLSHQKSRILQPSCTWSRARITSSASASMLRSTARVGVGSAGGPYSDETDEDGMETESEMEEEDMDIDALVAHVTIVFEGGRPWPCAAAQCLLRVLTRPLLLRVPPGRVHLQTAFFHNVSSLDVSMHPAIRRGPPGELRRKTYDVCFPGRGGAPVRATAFFRSVSSLDISVHPVISPIPQRSSRGACASVSHCEEAAGDTPAAGHVWSSNSTVTPVSPVGPVTSSPEFAVAAQSRYNSHASCERLRVCVRTEEDQ